MAGRNPPLKISLPAGSRKAAAGTLCLNFLPDGFFRTGGLRMSIFPRRNNIGFVQVSLCAVMFETGWIILRIPETEICCLSRI